MQNDGVWEALVPGRVDMGRSFPLKLFRRIASLPEVRLISLQKGHGAGQLTDSPQEMAVETLGPDFDAGPDAFLDTAAVMQHLDRPGWRCNTYPNGVGCSPEPTVPGTPPCSCSGSLNRAIGRPFSRTSIAPWSAG